MEEKEPIIITYEEEIQYIKDTTGIDEEIICKIIDADYDF